MPSLSAKDRVSLCQFTFADGRCCRTPRTGKNPHFCFDHAQKEARANAAESLGNDLDFFFSADYLSACDLSTALGRLIPAVLRGDVKPRTARTVAYLAQTLLQTIRMSQHEYCEAFDPDGWRDSIRNSVNGNYNHNHRFPPTPEPDQPESPQPQPAHPQPQPAQTPVNCRSPLATHHSPLPQAPHTPLPSTAAEFAQQVMAGLQTGAKSSSPNPQPASPPPQPAASTTNVSPPTPPPTPATQPSPQLQPPPEPRPPIAATPSAPREEPRPAAGPQTGPSGLPVLAPLPPRKPGASPVCGPS